MDQALFVFDFFDGMFSCLPNVKAISVLEVTLLTTLFESTVNLGCQDLWKTLGVIEKDSKIADEMARQTQLSNHSQS